MWHVRLFLALLAVPLVTTAPAYSEKRLALVVGNANYYLVPDLMNPGNDAEDMGRALAALGFETTVSINQDLGAMRARLEEFGKRAQFADVVLFYFAGHGFQVDGENYLAPVDFDIGKDISQQAILLSEVLKLAGR